MREIDHLYDAQGLRVIRWDIELLRIKPKLM